MQFTLYSIVLLLSAVLSSLLGLYAWYRRRESCAWVVFWMAVGMVVWSLAAAGEAMILTLAGKVFWSVLSYVGIVSVPPLFLVLALLYTGRTRCLQFCRCRMALFVIPGLTLLIAATNPLHGWLWSEVRLFESPFGVAGQYDRGVWFWIYLLHAYALVATAVALLLRAAYTLPSVFARQARLMALAAVFPLIGNLAYAINPRWTGGFDFAPVFFTVATILLGRAILRGRWLDVMPLAPHVIMKHLHEGITVFDQKDRLIGLNPAAARILGVSDQDVGKDASEIFARFPGAAGLLKHAERSAADYSATDAGTQIVEFSHIPVEGPYSRFHWHLLTLRDVTARRLAEEERVKLQEELLLARKTETIGRLAGGIAHDFNNQLMGIMGYAQLSLDVLSEDASVARGYQQEILVEAERSANLVRQLLAYARKQPAQPESLSLNDAIEGMLTLLERLAGDPVAFSWLPEEGLRSVQIDPLQLDQVLVNLVINARDAIRETGRITVRTGMLSIGDDHVWLRQGCEPGAYVSLVVEDDGCGMDEEIRQHLFEPFFTTKGAGRGMGLSTVYGIVKQNRGYIYLESKPGGPTRFTVLFVPQEAEPLSDLARRGTRL